MALRSIPLKSSAHASLSSTTIDEARELIHQQASAIEALAKRIDDDFVRAVELVCHCRGRLVVSGVGKSGHVARKLAATFASTGTPALFLHPTEASHGDLGMVSAGDVLLLISYSGETEELLQLIPHFKEIETPIIALVGQPQSRLALSAEAVLQTSVLREICPHNLAPTTSALASLALGDALAISVMRRRDFRPEDFARNHPAGLIKRGLLTRVRESMKKADLPLVTPDQKLGEALVTMTQGRCGLLIVVDSERRVSGIVTDGDLRRALQRHPDLLGLSVREIMTPNPVTISETATLGEAQERMQRLRLKALIVLDASGKVTGVVEIFNGQ